MSDTDDIPPQWCPDCGNELAPTGLQPAGIGQYFCEVCRRRHDHYVGQVGVSASHTDCGTVSSP